MRLRGAALILGLGILAGLFAARPAPPAAAHGGVVWIDDDYGALHLVVQTSSTLNDNQVRFTILLTGRDYGPPVTGAQVHLRAVISDTAASGVAPLDLVVPPESGQDGYYDSTITVPRYGDWRVTVAVQRGTDTANAGFTLPVQPTPPISLTSPAWWPALIPILLGLATAVFLYFWRMPPKPQPEVTSTDSAETTDT